MTELQQKKVSEYEKIHIENCNKYAMYGSRSTCVFNKYNHNFFADEGVRQENIILEVVSIKEIDEYYQPHTDVSYIVVEPDGNALNLEDVFSHEDVMDLIDKLKKEK